MQRHALTKEIHQLLGKQDELLQRLNREAWKWALTDFTARLALFANQIDRLCKAGGVVAQLRDAMDGQNLAAKDHTLERFFLDDQLTEKLKLFIQGSEERKALWSERLSILPDLVEGQFSTAAELEEYLRRKVEGVFLGNNALITNTVSELLTQRDVSRLDDIYLTLSDTAVVYAQRDVCHQDDPAIEVELFSIHGSEERENLDVLALYPQIYAVESVDELRWIFMRVLAGLHFDTINFSVTSLASP